MMLGVGETEEQVLHALKGLSHSFAHSSRMNSVCRTSPKRRRCRHVWSVHATDQATHEGRPVRRAGGVR
jgi:hypothetical protein